MENEEKISFIKKVFELFNRYGIRSVTMDDISRELGMSKKTLYEIVANKEELIEMIVDFEIAKRVEMFECIRKENLNAIDELLEINIKVKSMMKSYNPAIEFDLKKYYPVLFNKVRETKYKNMFDVISSNMKKGISEKLYRDEVNVEIISNLYVSRINYMMEQNVFSQNDLGMAEFLEEVNIYHIRGLANSNGIEYLEKKYKKKDN